MGLIILVAATLIRVVYFVELSSTPLRLLQQWPQADMHYYDEWAGDVAAGDWLSRTVEVPMDSWHREVARSYRAMQGGGALPPDGSPEDERQDRVLWAAWMHIPRFYQDPLYPYLLAGIYRVFGRRPDPVFILQLAAGVATTLLIWSIAVRAFGDLVGAVAAALALLCAPLLFYELLLLRDSLLVTVSLLVTWLLFVSRFRERWWDVALIGVVIGAGCLLKSTLIFFAIGAAVILAAERRWRQVTILLAAFMIALSPVIARNVRVGTAPFALASLGPLTFVSANDVNYPPDSGFGLDVPLLVRFLGSTPGTWTDAIELSVGAQSVESYAGQLWEKWTRAWHWYEIPNNENFYYAKRLVPVLAALPITFWLISPLALIGIALAVPGWRRHAPLLLLLATAVVPLLAFYVLGRFRLLLIAATIPYAACALVEVSRLVSRRRVGAALATVAAAVTVSAWTGQGLGPHQTLIRTSDWIVPFSVLYETRIETAAAHRDWTTAAHLYADYFTHHEPSLTGLDWKDAEALGSLLASMHGDSAELFELAGDRRQAAAQRALAERLATPPR